MRIHYEIIDADDNIINTVTGTQLRARFGLTPTDDVFNERLVLKYNLEKECAGKPERIRQVVTGGII